MKTTGYIPLVSCLLLLTGTALRGQGAEEEFARQAQILEEDLEEVFVAGERAREAVQRLRDLNAQLVEMLGDFDAPVAEMRRLESRVATALDNVYQSLQATARARSLVYDQMDRLTELARQVEATAPEPISEDNPQGLWELRLEPIGVHALVEMELREGGLNQALVAVGSYRTSNGTRGTLRGTFGAGRMELEVMDSRHGKVADLRGVVGLDGRLEGTWRRPPSGLDQGRASAGTFTGHRVAAESDVSLD